MNVQHVDMPSVWALFLLSLFMRSVGGDGSLETVSVTTSKLPTSLTTPKPTLTLITNSTVAPASEVKYNLKLNMTGTSVLDSTITFRAELVPVNALTILPPGKNFIYQWMNMANMEKLKTEDGLSSKISITFPSEDAEAGDYPMTVAAFHKSNITKIIAFETKKFTLTEKLNGHLIFEQDLEYQRIKNVFCTGEDITIKAIVHDRFREKSSTRFEYFWFSNETFLTSTRRPNYTTIFQNPTEVALKSVITLTVKLDDTDTETNSSLFQANSWEQPADAAKRRDDPFHLLFKDGVFEHELMFKDPLINCSVVRAEGHPDYLGIPLGEGALINVTCNGSPPTGVCLDITIHNTSIPTNETCEPEIFNNTLQHQIRVFLNSTGWQDINFYIYNDVTRVHIVGTFFGYNKNSSSSTALILPVVFGVLGIVVIFVGTVFIMRLRKKPIVEVADFDFHPTLTSSMQSEASIKITRVVSTIKHMFSRNRYESTHRHPRAHSDVTPLSQESPSKELYESL